ncbi:MAG: hypothetical protein INR68_17030 [Methylobacterium mesophilicum]|nr:hypothetical protein [Methylobacterium mesophilicum]
MTIQAWKVRFVFQPAASGGSFPTKQPGLPTAMMEEFEFKRLSIQPDLDDGELLLICVPTATEMTTASQQDLERWARTKPAADDPVIEASLRTVRAICSSRRAVVFCDEHMTDAVEGLLRMLNLHRELMRLESEVAARLGDSQPSAGRHAGGADLGRAVETRLAYLRLRNALERPDRLASIRSQRLFSELAATAQLAERLDAVEEPIQAFHELAEAASTRTSERSHFLISTVAEAAIALLLAIDLLWMMLH